MIFAGVTPRSALGVGPQSEYPPSSRYRLLTRCSLHQPTLTHPRYALCLHQPPSTISGVHCGNKQNRVPRELRVCIPLGVAGPTTVPTCVAFSRRFSTLRSRLLLAVRRVLRPQRNRFLVLSACTSKLQWFNRRPRHSRVNRLAPALPPTNESTQPRRRTTMIGPMANVKSGLSLIHAVLADVSQRWRAITILPSDLEKLSVYFLRRHVFP